MGELFGAAVFPEWATFTSLMARFLLDLLFTVIAVRVASRLHHQRDYIFTYLLLNVVTFSWRSSSANRRSVWDRPWSLFVRHPAIPH